MYLPEKVNQPVTPTRVPGAKEAVAMVFFILFFADFAAVVAAARRKGEVKNITITI